MIGKEERIQDLRNKISYWTEKLKITIDQVERAVISDKILDAKKEIGLLQSKSLDRVRRVDIIDAPPVADRLEAQAKAGMMGRSTERVKLIFDK